MSSSANADASNTSTEMRTLTAEEIELVSGGVMRRGSYSQNNNAQGNDNDNDQGGTRVKAAIA